MDILDEIDAVIETATFGPAMDSVRDLLDGANGGGVPDAMRWTPTPLIDDPAPGYICQGDCDCRGAMDKVYVPMISGQCSADPFHHDRRPAEAQSAALQSAVIHWYARGYRGFTRHEIVWAGLPEDAWDLDTIPGRGPARAWPDLLVEALMAQFSEAPLRARRL